MSFADDGFERLGALLPIDHLGERVDELMLGRVKHEGLFFQRDHLVFGKGWQGPSLEYRKLEKLELDPLFLDYMRAPPFEELARRFIEGPISLYRAVVFTKSAGGGSELPWHQDGGAFWGVDRAPTLQIWTALDDMPEDGGCLEVIPRTHRAGLARASGGLVPPELLEGKTPLSLPVKKGEVILLHNHLWHRSRASRSGHRRSALSVCYMSASTKCLRKKRPPRQFRLLFV